MEDDIVAKLIPILVVAFLAAIPISAQFFAYRKRKADLATIRLLVERCETVDQAALAQIAGGTRRRFRDLRRGLILLALVLPGLVLAFLMESLRAQLFVLAIAGLPFTLGLVHLAFHFLLTGRDEH